MVKKQRITGKNVLKVKNSGYSQQGASHTKSPLIAWNPFSQSAHEDITLNLSTLRERSRDLYNGGAPIGRGAIERVLLSSIGVGLTFSSRISAEALGMTEDEAAAWGDKVETEFGLWADSKECDINRQMNFYELQNLCFRSVLINGDALVMLPMKSIKGVPYDLKIALIESDRLGQPNVSTANRVIDGGVELNDDGMPIAYWIANKHPYSSLAWEKRLEYSRIPAFGNLTGRRNVLHIFHAERIGQHRGIPFLSPVIEILKQLGRYTDAELMAAVVGGMFAVVFEHQINPDAIGATPEYASDGLGDEISNPDSLSSIDFSKNVYGAALDLPEGVKATTISPSRPNQQFQAFVEALTKQLGASLGLPAEVLLLNFTASYSASRAALLEAWKLFRYKRQWWAQNFCQPIFEEWLHEAILKGRIDAPGFLDDPARAYFYTWADWQGPSQGQIDPVKEVTAAKMRVENGFSTRQQETAELTGGEFDLLIRQRAKEEQLIKELGLKTEPANQTGGEDNGSNSESPDLGNTEQSE